MLFSLHSVQLYGGSPTWTLLIWSEAWSIRRKRWPHSKHLHLKINLLIIIINIIGKSKERMFKNNYLKFFIVSTWTISEITQKIALRNVLKQCTFSWPWYHCIEWVQEHSWWHFLYHKSLFSHSPRPLPDPLPSSSSPPLLLSLPQFAYLLCWVVRCLCIEWAEEKAWWHLGHSTRVEESEMLTSNI